MKNVIITLGIFAAGYAQASIDSEIQKSAAKFMSKNGVGMYMKNGAIAAKDKGCYIAINVIDAQDVTAKNFEITVGSTQLGTDIESWNEKKNAVVSVVSKNGKTSYAVNFMGWRGCKNTQQIVFTANSIEFMQKSDCDNNGVESKNERMICRY